MALNAQGVYERMGNYMHQLEIGKNLTPGQVKDFNDTSQKIYDASAGGQKLLDSEYTRQAQEYGLTPSRIVRDYYYKEPAKPQETTGTASLADIAATAKASGKTTAEVTAALKAKGFTIGGR